jgi:HAD superfamily hydrolase (TIGR01450 family)
MSTSFRPSDPGRAERTPLVLRDAEHVLATYDALLLDAYGVLVDAAGALPHAQAFIAALVARKIPYALVTNDAARLPEAIAARMQGLGLPFATEQVVSSASLLTAHFAQANLVGAHTLVVGTDDARTSVRRAGGTPVSPLGRPMPEVDAIVVCEARGAQMMADVECCIDTVVARRRAGRDTPMVLCNPDLIYPAQGGRLGLTSGSTMLLIEQGLRACFGPHVALPIARLGKPFPEIFAAGVRAVGPGRLALIGDQLGTDVRGANDFGIDSVLVGTGLTALGADAQLDPSPSVAIPNLQLAGAA